MSGKRGRRLGGAALLGIQALKESSSNTHIRFSLAGTAGLHETSFLVTKNAHAHILELAAKLKNRLRIPLSVKKPQLGNKVALQFIPDREIVQYPERSRNIRLARTFVDEVADCGAKAKSRAVITGLWQVRDKALEVIQSIKQVRPVPSASGFSEGREINKAQVECILVLVLFRNGLDNVVEGCCHFMPNYLIQQAVGLQTEPQGPKRRLCPLNWLISSGKCRPHMGASLCGGALLSRSHSAQAPHQ
jgi:hypothetical protein